MNEVYSVRVNDSKSNTYFQYFVTFFSLNNVDTALTSDSELVPAKTPAEFDLGTALKPARKTDPSQYPKPLPAQGTQNTGNVTGITLNHTAANVTVGETVKLTVSRTPAGAAGRLVFTSSDEGVAMVASSGIVTGKKTGTATITAKIGEVSVSCIVTVVTASVKPPANTPASATGEGIKILAYPTKPDYKLGEIFDTTGINVINCIDGKETNVNGKITFFIQKINGVQLTEKSKFAVTGKKIVQLRFEGKKVGTYTINVTKASAPTESPTNTPSPVPSKAVKILANPSKTAYKLGEGFDTTGLKAVIGEGDGETNINDKITFYTSKTVRLTQGRKFTTTGTKVVEIRYDGKKVSAYTIIVTK